MVLDTEEKIREHLEKIGKYGQFRARVLIHRRSGATEEDARAKALEELGVDKEKPRLERKPKSEAPRLTDNDEKYMEKLAQQAQGKECRERDAVRWVFENIAVPCKRLQDPPSAGAVGLLRWVKSDRQNEAEFYKVIWPKVIPTRQALEEADKVKGDDSDLDEVIQKVMEAAQ